VVAPDEMRSQTIFTQLIEEVTLIKNAKKEKEKKERKRSIFWYFCQYGRKNIITINKKTAYLVGIFFVVVG
jgi:hypothetical protein